MLCVILSVGYSVHCYRTLEEDGFLAVAAGFVGPYPDTSWAARICDGFLGSVDALVDIRGTIESATLSRNGDVAIKSTIGVLVVHVPIGYSTRLADHLVFKAFASRSCDYAFCEPGIGFLRVSRIVLVEAICKFLLMPVPSTIVTVVILGVYNL